MNTDYWSQITGMYNQNLFAAQTQNSLPYNCQPLPAPTNMAGDTKPITENPTTLCCECRLRLRRASIRTMQDLVDSTYCGSHCLGAREMYDQVNGDILLKRCCDVNDGNCKMFLPLVEIKGQVLKHEVIPMDVLKEDRTERRSWWRRLIGA